jgi:peptide/nickel transport system permease protein
VLSVKTRPYVERSRALGRQRLAPEHATHPAERRALIFANTILTVAVAILSESTLAFLGLGDPLSVSWGTTLENAFARGPPTPVSGGGSCRRVWRSSSWSSRSRCAGFALDEILNPKLRQR